MYFFQLACAFINIYKTQHNGQPKLSTQPHLAVQVFPEQPFLFPSAIKPNHLEPLTIQIAKPQVPSLPNQPFFKTSLQGEINFVFLMSSGNHCVKVVIINTKYVETDAMSFKDVVQRLTGKDSRVAYEVQEPNNVVAKSQYVNVMEPSNNTSCSVNGGKTTTMSPSNSSVLMKNISFKEFERLFREMPPMEDFLID